MSASPEVPSAAAPPLPDDIKDLIAKEYDRPVEEKAERKWVEKNASQLADMPVSPYFVARRDAEIREISHAKGVQPMD